jgi:hypothetical protein
MLTAFYVDNGKQLPAWKDLPHVTHWLLPLLVATPRLVRASCGIHWCVRRAGREA